MIEGYKIPNVIFNTREGDISENDLIIISRIPDNLNNKKVNIEIN